MLGGAEAQMEKKSTKGTCEDLIRSDLT